MSENWPFVYLSELISIKKGHLNEKNLFVTDNITFIKPKQIQSGYIENIKELSRNSPALQKRSFLKVERGDLLISLEGSSLGNVAIYNEEATALAYKGVGCINIYNPSLLNKKYLFYILQSSYLRRMFKKFNINTNSSVLRNLYLESIKIPLPDLDKQKRIVNDLLKIEEITQKRKKSKELIYNYEKALFIELFGHPQFNPRKWPLVKLGEIITINPSKRDLFNTNFNINSKAPFLRMMDVSNEGKVNNLSNEITINKAMKSTYCIFKNNDVLLAKISPSFENGKGAVIQNLDANFGFGSTEFFVLRPGIHARPQWLHHTFRFEYIRAIAINSMVGNSGRLRLSASFLKNLEVPFPPTSIQEEFESYIAGMSTILSRQTESNKKIENLFNSYLTNLFKGIKLRG